MKSLHVRILSPSFLLWLLFSLGITTGFAQPHIQGKVKIDQENGTIRCNFTLEQVPNLADYGVLLHKGMNVKFFRDSEGQLLPYRGYYNGEIVGSASSYVFKGEDKDTLEIPSTFSVEYVGAYPIYTDSLNTFDLAEHIAWNKQTLRMSAQSAWYPVIYDRKRGKAIDQYTYDISVELSSTSTIFINGTPPVKARTHQFRSTSAHPLLVFIGAYDFWSNDGNYLLNIALEGDQGQQIGQVMDTVKHVLSNILDQKFDGKVFLINHQPISADEGVWAFNSYPTLAFSGIDFGYVVEAYGGLPAPIYKLFGHEFSHNYFGLNVFSGPLAYFWSESISEYLSYRVAEQLFGVEYLGSEIIAVADGLRDADGFPPLADVKDYSEISDTYKYQLGPLVWRCFEDQFGKEKVDAILKDLMQISYDQTLTLDIWKESALQAGISAQAFDTFYLTYLASPTFKDQVIEDMLKRYK
ncbi:MAG: hypothetical protein AAF135_04365 [Bacteroidota bacterium]